MGLRSLLGFSWPPGQWVCSELTTKFTFMFTSVAPPASGPDLPTTKQRKPQGSGEPHQGLAPVWALEVPTVSPF